MIAALSVPEHCLSFYLVCDDQIKISCAVWLCKIENLAVTFCYLWLTEKLWLLWGSVLRANAPTPFYNINYIATSHFLTTRPAVGCWVGKKGLYFDRIPFNRWLKLFNCQIFSRLAFGIKGCSSETRLISSVFRLLCIALWHYVREHIIYTVYSDFVLV